MLVFGSLAFGSAAMAQDTTGVTTAGGDTTTITVGGDTTVTDGTTGTTPPPEAGSYDKLSSGNQKIAESLFEGQTISGAETTATETGTATGANGTGTEPQAWTLDQIAAAKQDGQGWGQIFKQMKADGVVDAKNLGQMVSGHNKTSTTATTGKTGQTEIVVTSANGQSRVMEKSKHENRGRGSLHGNSGKSAKTITAGTTGRGSGHGSGSRHTKITSGITSGHGGQAGLHSRGGGKSFGGGVSSATGGGTHVGISNGGGHGGKSSSGGSGRGHGK